MSLPKLTIFFNGCVIAQQLNVVLFTHMFIVVLEITWDKIIENNAFLYLRFLRYSLRSVIMRIKGVEMQIAVDTDC